MTIDHQINESLEQNHLLPHALALCLFSHRWDKTIPHKTPFVFEATLLGSARALRCGAVTAGPASLNLKPAFLSIVLSPAHILKLQARRNRADTVASERNTRTSRELATKTETKKGVPLK